VHCNICVKAEPLTERSACYDKYFCTSQSCSIVAEPSAGATAVLQAEHADRAQNTCLLLCMTIDERSAELLML